MDISQDDLITRGIESESDAVFTTDKFGAFNVNSILRYAVEHGARTLARLNVAHSMICVSKCDLDMEHIFRLMKLTDRELYARTLLLYINAGDGTHICVDGNHRLAELCSRARARGEEWIDVPSLVISLDEAKRFSIRYFKRDETGIEHEISSSEVLRSINGCYTDNDGTIRDMRRAS